MPFKEYVENHPLVMLCSVAVAAATVAAGVAGFFAAEEMKLDQARFESELGRVHLGYKQEIDDFSRRLASIERRVGENPKYFDVSNVILSADQARFIGNEYRDFINGFFYVSVPVNVEWKYEITNEYEVIAAIYPDIRNIIPDVIRDAYKNSLVHLWRNKHEFIVECRYTKSTDPCSRVYFPLVTARRIDSDMFAERLKLLGYALLREKEGERDDREEIGAEISSTIASSSEKKSREYYVSGEKSASDVSLDAAKEKLDSTKRLIKNLENLLDEQLASVLLIDRMFSAFRLATAIQDAAYVVHGLQKKGNIFYYHGELKLQNVKIKTNANAGDQPEFDHLVVSEEMFFVGTRTDGLFIHVLVPSLDGRSGAYDWVQRWLSDFRVVL